MPRVTSGRALAEALGVVEGSVRKALKRGAIPRESDGSFDVERCRAAWNANTDPARTKVPKGTHDGAQLGTQCAPATGSPEVRTEDAARAAVALIRRILVAEGMSPESIDYNAARTAETILKTHERDFDLAVKRGKFAPIDEIGEEVERDYAVVRSRLISIPGKIAPKLVGLPLTAIRLAIEDEIAEALAELHAPSRA